MSQRLRYPAGAALFKVRPGSFRRIPAGSVVEFASFGVSHMGNELQTIARVVDPYCGVGYAPDNFDSFMLCDLTHLEPLTKLAADIKASVSL